jgi:hypothetical protein
MTSRATRAIRAAGLLAVTALACGGCTLLPRTPASPAPPASTTAWPAAAATAQPAAAAVPPASLPFPPARLQAAASLAGRFTTAWDSWSWRQSPAAWLARLRPMSAAELDPALTQAAGDRGVRAHRAAARQSATTVVTALAITVLTPASVTVTVTVTQVLTGSNGTSRSTAGWAITLTPAGTSWLVWDIEPAGAGNS